MCVSRWFIFSNIDHSCAVAADSMTRNYRKHHFYDILQNPMLNKALDHNYGNFYLLWTGGRPHLGINLPLLSRQPHDWYITVTSQWACCRLKSPASRLFTQTSIPAQIKEIIKTLRHWPLCGEFTGGNIPRTNGQLRGKCFHLMTLSWSPDILWENHRMRSSHLMNCVHTGIKWNRDIRQLVRSMTIGDIIPTYLYEK